jgi:hypothetical protein
MRILRHAHVEVTMDVYAEVSDEQTLRALTRLGKQLGTWPLTSGHNRLYAPRLLYLPARLGPFPARAYRAPRSRRRRTSRDPSRHAQKVAIPQFL